MQQRGAKNERDCLLIKITHMDQIHRVDKIFLDPFLA